MDWRCQSCPKSKDRALARYISRPKWRACSKALKKGSDKASQERLEKLKEDLVELEGKSAQLTRIWQFQKDHLADSQKVKEELDAAPMGLERMQRDGDLSRADHPIADHRMLDEEVTDNDIAAIVSRWTGIPVDKMLAGEREKLLRMERMIGDRVIGQEEAVIAVSNAVRRARAGLQDPNRPLGSFLFLGPTGVGKTELTKALAAFLFDDESAMQRLDMSEYMENIPSPA